MIGQVWPRCGASESLGQIRSARVCQLALGEAKRVEQQVQSWGWKRRGYPSRAVTLFTMDGVMDSGLSIGAAKSRQRGRCRRLEGGGGPAGSGAWALGDELEEWGGRGSPVVWFGPQAQVVLTFAGCLIRPPLPGSSSNARVGGRRGRELSNCGWLQGLRKRGRKWTDGGRRGKVRRSKVEFESDAKCAVAKPWTEHRRRAGTL